MNDLNNDIVDQEISGEDLEAEEPEHLDLVEGEPDEEPRPEEPDEDDDTLVIAFGDEEIEDEPDNKTIRTLRARLKEEIAARKAAESKVPKVEVGPRPKLADFDYDEERHEAALDEWVEKKAAAEAQKKAAPDPDERAREEFNRDFDEYQTQKARLARPDYDNSESAVMMKLDNNQQAALVSVAKNKAAMVYALGKSPERLETLSAITNPFKFATAVAEIERSLKVSKPNKKAPAPEGRPRGGTPVNPSNTRDKVLDSATAGGDVTDQLKKLRALRSKS